MSTVPKTPALRSPPSFTPQNAPQSTVPGSTVPADTAKRAAETTVWQDSPQSTRPPSATAQTDEEDKEIIAMYRVKHPEWRSHGDKNGQPVEKQPPSTPSSGS
jgi:hypothetical protein